MKKILILLLLFAFPLSAMAQLSDAYTTIEKKVTQTFAPENKCAIYADTPREDIDRPDFEIDFRVGILDSPTGGTYALTIDNYDLVLRHNLSSTLFAYVWFGERDYVKADVNGSVYEPKWEARNLFGGIGVYLMPTISVYAAAGNIWLTNESGDAPELDTAIEKGISIDAPLWQNKIVVSYRIIDAKLKSQEDIDVSEIQGDGSYSVLSVSFSVPFNWGQ